LRYASAAAFRQALETRLLALSRSQGSSLVRLRKEVAFDRLLARLLVAAPSLPLELQVAEKLHAYTRGYGGEGAGSTRVKDIVDLALVASTARLDAARLCRAVNETFERRSGRALPPALPRPPRDWEVPFRRLAAEIDLVADLEKGHGLAAQLLDPILSGKVTSGSWDAAAPGWLADRPTWNSEVNG
jgi:hypothetical protein